MIGQWRMDDGFGHWLAGFIDGEGSFNVPKLRRASGTGFKYFCKFHVNVRCDDETILRTIQARVGHGKIYVRPKQGGEDQASWHVHTKDGCSALVALLDRYPLRAKKRHDFEIWRMAVEAWWRIPARNADWSDLARLRDELIEGRRFKPLSFVTV